MPPSKESLRPRIRPLRCFNSFQQSAQMSQMTPKGKSAQKPETANDSAYSYHIIAPSAFLRSNGAHLRFRVFWPCEYRNAGFERVGDRIAPRICRTMCQHRNAHKCLKL
jgi:hypothetical protein